MLFYDKYQQGKIFLLYLVEWCANIITKKGNFKYLYTTKNEEVTELDKTIMSVKDLADFLGLSTDIIYREVRCGKIPHARLGSTILFRRDTVTAWLENQEANSVGLRKEGYY